MSEIREQQVQNGVNFLKHEKVQSTPLDKRLVFLREKGLTDAEIQAALTRAGLDPEAVNALPAAPAQPTAATGAAPLPLLPPAQPSLLSRIITAGALLLTGGAVGVLARRTHNQTIKRIAAVEDGVDKWQGVAEATSAQLAQVQEGVCVGSEVLQQHQKSLQESKTTAEAEIQLLQDLKREVAALKLELQKTRIQHASSSSASADPTYLKQETPLHVPPATAKPPTPATAELPTKAKPWERSYVPQVTPLPVLATPPPSKIEEITEEGGANSATTADTPPVGASDGTREHSGSNGSVAHQMVKPGLGALPNATVTPPASSAATHSPLAAEEEGVD